MRRRWRDLWDREPTGLNHPRFPGQDDEDYEGEDAGGEDELDHKQVVEEFRKEGGSQCSECEYGEGAEALEDGEREVDVVGVVPMVGGGEPAGFCEIPVSGGGRRQVDE